MPIYEYKCLKCGKLHEVTQKMSDPPLAKCPDCKGKMKKQMSLAGFHLKGGGWYKDGYSSPKPEAKPKESTQPSETASPTPSKDAPQTPPKKETPDPKPAKAASSQRTKKS